MTHTVRIYRNLSGLDSNPLIWGAFCDLTDGFAGLPGRVRIGQCNWRRPSVS